MKTSLWYTALILTIPTCLIAAFLLYVTVDWTGAKSSLSAFSTAMTTTPVTATSATSATATKAHGHEDEMITLPYAVRFHLAKDISITGLTHASSSLNTITREWRWQMKMNHPVEDLQLSSSDASLLQALSSEMQEAMQSTQNPPAEWKPAHAELLNLYTEAAAMIDSATAPTGSYLSFTSTAQARTARATDAANRIHVLVPE